MPSAEHATATQLCACEAEVRVQLAPEFVEAHTPTLLLMACVLPLLEAEAKRREKSAEAAREVQAAAGAPADAAAAHVALPLSRPV